MSQKAELLEELKKALGVIFNSEVVERADYIKTHVREIGTAQLHALSELVKSAGAVSVLRRSGFGITILIFS